jgi:predicted ArsR family transcriptional regulator
MIYNYMEDYPTSVKIILLLKESPGMSLDGLSKKLGISKMAVLNHISELERQGAIFRKTVKKSVGRPLYIFYAGESSNINLGTSSDAMLADFMDYLKNSGNEKILEAFLRDRYEKVQIEYSRAMVGKDLGQRVNTLAEFRRDAEYYPQVKKSKENYELTEFNCPILSIAKNFSIACSLETKMFSSVLDANVNSTHRQVNGYPACRFLISKNKE